MANLDDFARLGRQEHGLTVISTARADGSVQASLVNAGVLPHPLTAQPCLAFVTYGRVKLANLRRRPRLAATVRSGWHWVSVEGESQIIGPDDPHPAVDPERLRLLLREVFSCAGGSHDDWAAYDQVMVEQRRAAVLVAPERVYSNPNG
jgi:PPOX class probable F420-dependent enzyme